MKKLLLLNGPPRSGKDTLAEELVYKYSYEHEKFSTKLKNMTHRLYGINCDLDAFDDVKDKSNELFFGLTPRQAYIAVSETYIKPVHDKDFFGRLLAKELEEEFSDYYKDTTVVISDAGFEEEVIALVNNVSVKREDILFCKLQREGHTFERYNDSRGYLKDQVIYDLGIKQIWLDNKGTVDEFLVKAIHRLTNFIDN